MPFLLIDSTGEILAEYPEEKTANAAHAALLPWEHAYIVPCHSLKLAGQSFVWPIEGAR